MKRPSRGNRVSAATTRNERSRLAPVRVSLTLTDIVYVVCWFYGCGGPPFRNPPCGTSAGIMPQPRTKIQRKIKEGFFFFCP